MSPLVVVEYCNYTHFRWNKNQLDIAHLTNIFSTKVMNMIKLYGKPVRVNKASAHQKNLDVGANVFIGNLDPEVDEKLLYDTFSAFGVILQTPKVLFLF